MSKKAPPGFRAKYFTEEYASRITKEIAKERGITLSDSIPEAKELGDKQFWITEGLIERNENLKVIYIVVFMDSTGSLITDSEKYWNSTNLKNDIVIKNKFGNLQLSKKITKNGIVYALI